MNVTETLKDLHYVYLLGHLFSCLFYAFHRFCFSTVTVFAFHLGWNNVEQVLVYIAPLCWLNERTSFFIRIFLRVVQILIFLFVTYLEQA